LEQEAEVFNIVTVTTRKARYRTCCYFWGMEMEVAGGRGENTYSLLNNILYLISICSLFNIIRTVVQGLKAWLK
jgi:hypothetical protein